MFIFILIYILSLITLLIFNKVMNIEYMLMIHGEEFYSLGILLLITPLLNTILALGFLIIFWNKRK